MGSGSEVNTGGGSEIGRDVIPKPKVQPRAIHYAARAEMEGLSFFCFFYSEAPWLLIWR